MQVVHPIPVGRGRDWLRAPTMNASAAKAQAWSAKRASLQKGIFSQKSFFQNIVSKKEYFPENIFPKRRLFKRESFSKNKKFSQKGTFSEKVKINTRDTYGSESLSIGRPGPGIWRPKPWMHLPKRVFFFYTFLPGRHFTKGHLAKRASCQKGIWPKRASDQKGTLAKGENKSPDVAPM